MGNVMRELPAPGPGSPKELSQGLLVAPQPPPAGCPVAMSPGTPVLPPMDLLAHPTLETNLLHRPELPHHLFPPSPLPLFFFFSFVLLFLLWFQLRLSGFAIFP